MDSFAKSVKKPDRRITELQRPLLKKPFGVLMGETGFFRQLHKAKYERLIAVGDITTILLLANNIRPSVAIVDFICRRKKIPNKLKRIIMKHDAQVRRVKNPPGLITNDLLEVCREIFQGPKTDTKIFVEGEEDLAVIPAVIYAPNTSIVVYGQPDSGVVMVIVNDSARQKALKYLNEMEAI